MSHPTKTNKSARCSDTSPRNLLRSRKDVNRPHLYHQCVYLTLPPAAELQPTSAWLGFRKRAERLSNWIIGLIVRQRREKINFSTSASDFYPCEDLMLTKHQCGFIYHLDGWRKQKHTRRHHLVPPFFIRDNVPIELWTDDRALNVWLVLFAVQSKKKQQKKNLASPEIPEENHFEPSGLQSVTYLWNKEQTQAGTWHWQQLDLNRDELSDVYTDGISSATEDLVQQITNVLCSVSAEHS